MLPLFCTKKEDSPEDINLTEAKKKFFPETSFFVANELFDLSK